MLQMVSAQASMFVFFDGRGVPLQHHVRAFLSCLQANDVDRYHASNSGDDTSGGEQGLTEETPGILLGVRMKGNWAWL
jgi:hypothetical protein